MGNNRNSTLFYLIALLLLLAAGGVSFFFFQKSNAAAIENNRLGAEVQALYLEKAMVERELDSLNTSYNSVRTENEDLRGKLSGTAEMIAKKDAAIKKIKSQTQSERAALRKQIEELRRIKVEYETVIATLRSENDQLRLENTRLTDENNQMRSENTDLRGKMGDLAKQLEEQIRKTQSARFKATSFRVEVGRRNEKLTVRAKKAREITVSFDLVEVPEQYRGPQKLYLSITDDGGRPIQTANPTKVSIQAPAGQVPLIAQQVKAVSLGETQRLSFVYKMDERLKSGNYVVAIYCEFGLLGASSFRLS